MAFGLLLIIISGPLAAHQLKVFAYAEEGRISGKAYFAGGVKARGAEVLLENSDGLVVDRAQTDGEGLFSVTPNERQDYEVTAQTGDGHQAQWSLSAAELIGNFKSPRTNASEVSAITSADEAHGRAQLESLIERAVARQIKPLRDQLVDAEDRLRLQDILGGLGYIFGLAGLLLHWRARPLGVDR